MLWEPRRKGDPEPVRMGKASHKETLELNVQDDAGSRPPEDRGVRAFQQKK